MVNSVCKFRYLPHGRGGVIVIGGGGHAKVVIDALLRGEHKVVGVLEKDSAHVGKQICGIPVIGTDDDLPLLFAQGVRYAVIGIGHLGHGVFRNQIALHLHNHGFQLATVIHPSAIISSDVQIGAGTVVCAGAVINPGVNIGENCIINTCAVVEHDVKVGNNVHIAPNAAISGGTIIGDNVFIGMGSNIIQGLHLYDECIVGACSVVIQDVEAGETVIGIPAKRIKEKIQD